MNRSNFVILCALFLLYSCASDSKKTSELKEASFSFVSNPIEVAEQEINTLSIGSVAPDFHLPGTDFKYHSLSDYSDAKVVVIVFTCNHCPTAQAYEQRIIDMDKDYKSKGVQVIAISPNSPLGLLYEELGYSDLGDTFEDMVVRDKEQNFNFPYLYDGDDQKVTLAYGPVATPHTFVFDQDRKLKYVGRIDASEKPGTGQAEDLRNALDNILAGNEIPNATTKTFGCSTKWGWKTKMKTNADLQWSQKNVTLKEASLDELAQLMMNDGKKLRLVNVWATWCGPCRIEYPNFVVIQRMFGARDFEFISVSADKLSKKDAALNFLTSVDSALPNYIATNDDKYALIEAISPNWNGALPYTALIEPGGNIIWEYQGEVDFQKLKTMIVDHPMIGRVY